MGAVQGFRDVNYLYIGDTFGGCFLLQGVSCYLIAEVRCQEIFETIYLQLETIKVDISINQ